MRLSLSCSLVMLASLVAAGWAQTVTPAGLNLAALERARVLAAAKQYLNEAPRTVTAAQSTRSAGGLHDFFSEGDYWWPDPQNPDGPYVQRDGMTNPDNFVAHRQALMRLSMQVPALTAAWQLTKDRRYARHAVKHLRAWFIDEATRMNPHLKYSQAIKGRFTGRGIGVIDTIHLVEVARAIEVLQAGKALSVVEQQGINRWFVEYLQWLTTHQYGIDEREAKNNHGTCWVMQVAMFARLTGDEKLQQYCRERFKTVLLPTQIEPDGSQPLEMRRTKPYGYSLFNLDALTTICQILSTPSDNLWTFVTADGRGVRQAVAFMAPYVRDKKRWPLKPDVMYDAEWPMRHASLLFAGLAYGERDHLALWQTLRADSNVDEVIRNFFIRQPLLWAKQTQP